MGRINRPDTLGTELRELRRRIRRLESGTNRPPQQTAALTVRISAADGDSGVRLAVDGRPVEGPVEISADSEAESELVIETTGSLRFRVTVEPMD